MIKKVQDIMTKAVKVLSADSTVEEAVWELTRAGVGGAPVLDCSGHVVGMLSKTDLIDRAPGSEQAHVTDAMTPLVYYVRPSDPAITAVRLMLAEGIHRVVVVRERGRLAGIVTTMDVLRAIDRGMRFDGDVSVLQECHAEPAHAVEEEEV